MRIGLMLRSSEHPAPGAGRTVRWTELRELAQAAEEAGVDALLVPDHLLYRNSPPVSLPAGETRGTWECFTLLAALSEATRRVALGPFVACTAFRNPALLAKLADSLDEVSGGRLILGLGAGWHEPEFRAFGYPFDRLVGRFEEALRIVVPLLREGRVDFRGRYYEARDCELRPRGPRPGGPPIWIGARKPRMIGLVARYADAYNTDMLLDPGDLDGLRATFATLDEACRAIGRNLARVLRTSGVFMALPGWEDDPAGLPAGYLSGPVDAIVERLRDYAAAGVEHLAIWLSPWSRRGVEQLAPIVEAAHRL